MAVVVPRASTDTRNVRREQCQPTDDVPDAPCENCRKLSVTSKWPGPCIRAYFDDIVLAGALDTMGNVFPSDFPFTWCCFSPRLFADVRSGDDITSPADRLPRHTRW